ncbi:MAG: GAF domain-containing protein [Sphingomicrobium sp.]
MAIEDRLEDERRVAALARTGALDSGPERAFDQICRVAAELLKVPSAFVSLIGAKRHYTKSSFGDGAPGVDSFDVDLDISFCKFVVTSGEQFVVDDAREHHLLVNHQAVERGVIAYAGVPFEADGETIGALCVVDSEPRHWSQEDIDRLNALARSVEQLLVAPTRNEDRYSPEGERRVLDALREHIRALDGYRATVARSSKRINLDAERAAREVVTETSDALDGEFRECSDQLGKGLDQLVIDLRMYLGAEERRRKAADAFAAATGRLDVLQSAISEVSLAEEQLRIAALNAGLEL